MEQLTTLLAALAQKLGTTVEYLWSVLIKQAYIDGVMNIIYCIITIVLIICSIYYLKYYAKNYKEWYGSYDGKELEHGIVLGIVLVITCILTLCTIFMFIPTAITAFNNPEYWALQEILRTIK